MKQITRTLFFVVVAGVSVTAATVTHWITKPKPLEGFDPIGEAFFPDFEDPNEARSLRVVAFDEDTASVKEFKVEFQDGRWRIPSHHNYPADAEDRLAKTAASVIKIVRGALQSRRDTDYKRLGVVDPLTEDASILTGRGKRITMTKQDGSILADYIIGNEVEGVDGYYYVRRPDEKETYRAKLNIDLSTKFSDWIESDLLKVSSLDLVEIVVNKYSIDETKGEIVGREVNKLTRKTGSDPWKLDGLNEDTEELKTDDIRTMVNNLDDLKIVGVRPKPGGLNPDLTIDPKFVRNQLEFSILRSDLANKGFFLQADKDRKLHVYSNEGEMTAAANDGAVYQLRFGEVFTGSESEIEIGFTSGDEKKQGEGTDKEENKDKAKPKDNDKEQANNEKKDADHAKTETSDKKSDEKKPDEEKSDDKKNGEEKKDDKSALKKSRYLFVTVQFNADYIPDKPTKPVEPKKPPGLPAKDDAKSKPESKKSDASGDSAKKADSAKSDTKADDKSKSENGKDQTKSKDEKKPADGKESEKDKKGPQAEYDEAMKTYKADLEKYENDLKDYDKKVEDGKKKVDELNDRFAGWYYVISAESFENLRLARKDLVKPKEKSEDEKKDEKKSDNADTAAPAKKPVSGQEPAAAKKPAPENKPAPEKKSTPEKKSAPEKKPASEKKPAPEKK